MARTARFTSVSSRRTETRISEVLIIWILMLHNRSVELAKKFRVNLEVLSSLERKPGRY